MAMDKLLQFLDKIIPLLPFYPPVGTHPLRCVVSWSDALDRDLRVVMYPAASKRQDEASERLAIGLNVSLLETQNSSDASHPLAVNYGLSQDGENIVITPRVSYLDLLAHQTRAAPAGQAHGAFFHVSSSV
jgi:hypothetical protein